MEDVRLDSILSKVRGLVTKAEHPDTPEAEARLCREKADAMMLKYAIKQATLRDSTPAASRAKPGHIEVIVCEAGSPYETSFGSLIATVCEHTRTKAMLRGAGSDEKTRFYWRNVTGKPLMMTAQVYGFESDLRYFEILYTTLLLHMSNGIDPKFDVTAGDNANAYSLHNAGFNWGQIARMAWLVGHEFGWDGKDCASRGIAYPGQHWKKCYNKEIRLRGEEAVHLPAKFTDSAREVYRLNFARSYVATLEKRLWLAREGRTTGAELILKSAMDEVTKMCADEHPNAKPMERKDVPYNEVAWQAGNSHAKSADIGGQSVGRRVAGEL
jgi:Protein of unknown function (DUF2786)